MPLQIAHGLPSLLQQEEGQESPPCPGLLEAQCEDYKEFLPPSPDPDILNMVSEANAKYFTMLDIQWGYNNVRIQEGDEWKAAF